MLKKFYILLTFPFFVYQSSIRPEPAITTPFLWGRFGDQLFLFAKAKWFSHKYNLKLFYLPFSYSENLNLHRQELQINNDIEKQYNTKINITSERDFGLCNPSNTLYICNYFAEVQSYENIFKTPQLYQGLYQSFYENIIANPDFADRLRESLRPIFEIPTISHSIKSKHICIAIHVRTGGDFEKPLVTFAQRNSNEPLKFPPISFYAEQLKKLHALLDYQSIYVFMFTDDSNPQNVALELLNNYSHPNIQLDYRKENNKHNLNVIEDMWLMSQFDILVRGQSSYSVMAQIIGSFKLIIEPFSFHWNNTKLIMDNTMIVVPNYIDKKVSYFSFELPNNELKEIIQQTNFADSKDNNPNKVD